MHLIVVIDFRFYYLYRIVLNQILTFFYLKYLASISFQTKNLLLFSQNAHYQFYSLFHILQKYLRLRYQ